jgi:aspartyl-tRNA(Asn)/glutamyl-tRNA(Gln) amidotransferase subunit B
MERAVAYEIKRQQGLLESGGRIEKQTLGWDDAKQATFPQRTKEGSADYRYFPDPDLPSLRISEFAEFSADALRNSLTELPSARRARYVAAGLKAEDADSFVRDTRFGNYFDAVVRGLSPESVRIAGNYIANDLVKIVRDIESRDTKTLDNLPVSTENFRDLVALIAAEKVTSRAAKDILLALAEKPINPEKYAIENGLISVQDTELLETTVAAVIEANPSVVADYRAGKGPALEYLLGQCMRTLKGAGKPELLRELIKSKIGS